MASSLWIVRTCIAAAFGRSGLPLYGWIHGICVDSGNNVWFGTSDGAVVRLKHS